MTKEQAAELQRILKQVKASGIELNTALKESEASLRKQGEQINLNAQAAVKMAEALVEGRDALESAALVNKEVYSTLAEENTLIEERALIQQTLKDGYDQIAQVIESNANISAEERGALAEELASLKQKSELQEKISRSSADSADNTNRQATATERQAKSQRDVAHAFLVAANNATFQEKAVATVEKGVEKTKNFLSDMWKKGKEGALDLVETAAGAGMGAKLLYDAAGGAKTAYTALDKLNAGFARATGLVMSSDAAMKGFTDRIIMAARRNAELGMTTEDVGKSFTTLMEKSRTFGTLMAKNTVESAGMAHALAELAAKGDKMGISVGTTSSAIEMLGKTYRVTNIQGETEAFNELMINVARSTGQTADAVGKDAVKAFDRLAVYSLPQAKQIFKELSVTAAQTGLSVDDLLGTVKGFDDMEKAAESVGDLNAMLGGPYLNTLDLVNATEEERIAMIREAVEASGESFEDMDRFKQKAIAAEMGLSEAKAKQYFGVTQAAVDAGTTAVDQSAKSMNELEEGAKKNAVAMGDRWKSANESIVMVQGALKDVQTASHAASAAMIVAGGKVRDVVGGQITDISGKMKDAITKASGVITKEGATVQEVLQAVGEIGTAGAGAMFSQLMKIFTGKQAPAGAGQEEALPSLDKLFMNLPAEQGGGAAATGTAPAGTGNRIVIENKMYLDKEILWQKIDEKVSLEIQKALGQQ